MFYKWNGFEIPDYMAGGIKKYIEHGIKPGSFLTAVICNDLKEAVGKADDINIRNIPAYVVYFYTKAHFECWGSKEKMEAWIKAKAEERGDENGNKTM